MSLAWELDSWGTQSREFVLRVDGQGGVTALDERAAVRLGIDVGDSFTARAVPGTEEKLRRLLALGVLQPVAEVEQALVVGSGTVTCSFQARPDGCGGVALLGTWLPEDYGLILRQVSESMAEMQNLNRQIVRQKREIEEQKKVLERTLAELADSNKGITSLHLELEDKAEVLQRTAEMRSRVVANVSHEFRTPLHTILGLSRLLMEGPLDAEQRKQVQFIRSSAEDLNNLVDDLLDLASAEAGKMVVRPQRFKAADFLSAMRGTLRPLMTHPERVDLRFGEAPADLELETDQSKLAQVLRNLVSNALKFTEKGVVEVSMRTRDDDVVFAVRDTGIGIAREHFERIFEEFGQVENPLQGRTRGTGLGLPLSRRLAELLGGSLVVESEPGKGSTFTLHIPREHPEVHELGEIERRPLDPQRAPILVVEDDRNTIFIYEKYLSMADVQVVPARTIADAERLLQTLRPAAIVLDIMLDGESSWGFLSRLKASSRTRDIPVLVVTVTNKEQKARALGADEFWLKPVDQDQLLRKLHALRAGNPARVLVIDDDPRARYLVSRFLDHGPYHVVEAGSGAEGIAVAREQRPHVILLDFLLKGTTAFDVVDELKADPLTRHIPVIVVTSHTLGTQDLDRLASQTEGVVPKQSLSRELAINRIRDALRKVESGKAVALS